ncbi:prephenate dehydrogenase [Motilibacter rhizosphaerae]|uniref:Prephenate dehydrogenase n=1 Tax=Motilibacter rhizosphaerae TaxID=598652 RepID=A0A4Q7NC78_9ACTN|nr:prephenate dehydrogenase [Motilibacter rhizosphaerae]RZS80217.1 prephenate dehydrogenase [Motilibacter rhizosphaerae]
MTSAPAEEGGGALRTVHVAGAGLIGASVGLALRRAGVTVTLSDADPEVARRAEELGAGKAALPEEPVDVLVAAAPPAAVAGVLLEAVAAGRARTYTDVAGVKEGPLRAVADAHPGLASLVGGHPMAGRERSGPGAARTDLFEGRPWIVTPLPGSGAEHVERVEALALACGAVPVRMEPAEHDRAVALVSHAPHVVAALVAGRLAAAPERAVGVAGTGVRDITRVAESDPAPWLSLLTANAAPVAEVLRALRADLDRALDALDALAAGGATTDDVEALLRAGNAGRQRLPGRHGGPVEHLATVPVVVPDRPGELARLLVAVEEAGVNVEDLEIEHSLGQPAGLAEVLVRPGEADRLAAALTAAGWSVHR